MVKGTPESVKGVIGWTLGVGIIAFILLILVIIFGNLSGNVGFVQDTAGLTVINETTGGLNATGYILAEVNSSNSNYVITEVWANISLTPYLVPAANYSVSAGGNLTSTVVPPNSGYNDTNVSYTFTFSFDSQGQKDSEAIIGNYTASAVNTSAQFPTVGTIIGITILLAILIALLVFAIRRMMGVADTRGGDSNASFGDSRSFG